MLPTLATATAAAEWDKMSSSTASGDAHRRFCDVLEGGENGEATLARQTGALDTLTSSPSKLLAAPAPPQGFGGARSPSIETFEAKVASIRQDLVGRHASFRTPYGSRPLVYSDWTATGRAVSSIERYLYDEVVPLFGNTHTTTSITGAQTTCFRHEARQIIAQAVNAKVTGRAAEDVVLFTGTGATAAIAKLVSALGLAGPLPAEAGPNDRPVIFVGPFEHHSNLLPWRESCGEVVTIGEGSCGGLDVPELERKLRQFAARKLKIGSFSAASNVTGDLEDVDKVTATLHRSGALALWDYATAAPYVQVDMNPVASGSDDQALVSKDAIFFSGHKFVGGPGTPGVLVVKKRLLCNAVPGTVGGGTVFFVTENDHRYLSNKEEREEGGTPDILGSIRLGLAVQMKEMLGREGLREREEALARLGLETLRAHPKIAVLGDTGRKSLPIFSFLVRSKGGRLPTAPRFLHYNFVCALLNDLFGVQSRGGCQCAGPYSQRLLGISLPNTRAVETELLRKHELLRPGFSRFSLAYVNSDLEAKYILDAVLFVADNGASFLPQYRLNHKTGEWKHKTRFTRFPERRWLGHCNYGFPASERSPADAAATAATTLSSSTPAVVEAEQEKAMMEGVFEDASRHLRAAEAGSGDNRWQGAEDVLGAEGEALRWFPYPWEGGVDGDTTPAPRPQAPAPASTPAAAGFPELPSAEMGSRTGTASWCIVDPKVYGAGGVMEAKALGAARVSGERSSEKVAEGLDSGADEINGATMVLNSTHAAGEVNANGVSAPGVREGAGDAAGPTAEFHANEWRGGGEGAEVGIAAKDVVNREHAVVKTPGMPSSSRQPDDSHKYPLRSGGGAGLSSAAPPFLAAADDDTATGTVEVNGDINGKLKGYEGHMAALGKLGAGSPSARLFPTPGKKLLKAVGQAIQEWGMIEEGDRLCLGLSGGKDSMTLLHVLLNLQKRAPINFEIACATVDPQTASFDPSPLIPYLESLGVTLHYLSSPIIELAKTAMQGDSLCAFCARMKRGLLYTCCRDHGYNKLVLAQHLDDLAESFIMSALHNGQVRTMKANYKIEAGDVHVIRPLCYAREALTKDFARTNRLPVVNENCPACFEEPKERHRVKKMLAKEESLFPAMYANMRRAFVPLMDENAYEAMRKTSDMVAARRIARRTRPATKKKKKAIANDGRGQGGTAGSSAYQNGDTEEGMTARPVLVEGSSATALKGLKGAVSPAGEEEDVLRFRDVSDLTLERELERRRRLAAADTREGDSDSVLNSSPGVCGEDAGVCVPCFELA